MLTVRGIVSATLVLAATAGAAGHDTLVRLHSQAWIAANEPVWLELDLRVSGLPFEPRPYDVLLRVQVDSESTGAGHLVVATLYDEENELLWQDVVLPDDAGVTHTDVALPLHCDEDGVRCDAMQFGLAVETSSSTPLQAQWHASVLVDDTEVACRRSNPQANLSLAQSS